MKKPKLPYIGIIYCINGEILIDSTPLNKAEKTVDFIDHPRSHHEFWEALQEASISEAIIHELTRRDYDYYPRGRVLYSINNDMFIIYLDKCIINRKDLVEEIVKRMNLPEGKYKVMPDFHYQCAICNKDYQ